MVLLAETHMNTRKSCKQPHYSIYTNLPKVFVQHKITLVVNVPLWTNIKSGTMMGIEIYKYRKHTVLVLSLVKI